MRDAAFRFGRFDALSARDGSSVFNIPAALIELRLIKSTCSGVKGCCFHSLTMLGTTL